MNSRRYRKFFALFRIANTMFFGLLCVASIVLWIRSYWYFDGGMISTLPNQHIAFHGGSGRMCVWFEHSAANQWYRWDSRPKTVSLPPDAENRMPWFNLAFFWPAMTRLYVAHWFLAVMSALVAIVPWTPRRFGTVKLLITMAGIAVVMGLISWIDRTF